MVEKFGVFLFASQCSNLGRISHRFRDTAAYRLKIEKLSLLFLI